LNPPPLHGHRPSNPPPLHGHPPASPPPLPVSTSSSSSAGLPIRDSQPLMVTRDPAHNSQLLPRDPVPSSQPLPARDLAHASSPQLVRDPRDAPPPLLVRDPRDAPPPPLPTREPPPPPVRDAVPPAPAPPAPAPPAPAPPAPPAPPLSSVREAPPPPPLSHKTPPSPPPAKRDKAAAPTSTPLARLDGKPARGKPWFLDLFDEDYLRTLPFLTPQATQAEAEFVINSMNLSPGASLLDIGCGYGRHAMELAARGFHVVGLDISTPLLVRGGEEAHRRGLTINFIRGDMREIDFEGQFNGAYCLFSTFGYFDDETNKKTVANIARALRPGGRILIEILNRDYVIADLPTRVWWEGDGCVVLEEVELNYFSSRIQVNRSVVFDDGRQLEQEISVRAYSLHEVGKLLHAAGFRVLEVSGAYQTRNRFFGNQSRHIIVLAERREPSAA
jgi:SAM-dependent methyltransferase